MLARFFNRSAPPPPPHRVVVGSYNGYTLSEWQSSDSHIKWMRDQLGTSKFRDMLAVLANARPLTPLDHISDTEAAIALGRRIGYDEIFHLLLSLATVRPPDQPPIEPDYGASEFDLKKVL